VLFAVAELLVTAQIENMPYFYLRPIWLNDVEHPHWQSIGQYAAAFRFIKFSSFVVEGGNGAFTDPR